MKYICNPINLEYKYQFFKTNPEDNNMCEIHREAADPTIVLFNDHFYMFPSMSAGFYTSTDLCAWMHHSYGPEIPVYDYAPDVCVIGEYLYFSASKANENCSFYRTKNPLTDSFEEIEGQFPFWDPHLFLDDDGRLFFYWGCSNMEPIYGVELNPKTMEIIGEKTIIVQADTKNIGFERTGEDHVPAKSDEEVKAMVEAMILNAPEGTVVDDNLKRQLYGWFGNNPYVEGAWMTKYKGKYYFQFATPGTEYNTYGDGVYIGDSPLGPFKLAKNNPFSYKPGGFICGAGHGSTFRDKNDELWHTSTMRISNNHNFERRVGLWKAGFDADDELYCDQRYGDWPLRIDAKPWEKPDMMLLSYGKKVTVSSGENACAIVDENIKSFWQAVTNSKDESVILDLGHVCDIKAIQINFNDNHQVMADDDMIFSFNGQEHRAISRDKYVTHFLIEAAKEDGVYETLWNKTESDTDYSNDFMYWDEKKEYRYIRVTNIEQSMGQRPCISGLRVFGNAGGKLPEKAKNVNIELLADDPDEAMDMGVSFESENYTGANILWGYDADKLYHSYMIFGKSEQVIRALVKNAPVYVRIDTFNESGITEGDVIKVR